MIVPALTLLLASLASCQDTTPTTDPTTPTPSPACKEHDYAEEGCAPLPYICQINCDENDDANGCKIYNTDGTEADGATSPKDSCNLAAVEETFTWSSMDTDTCINQCAHSEAEDPSNRCRFWRYETLGQSKVCTLMSENQCMSWDECIGLGCQMGDQGCPAGAEPEPARSVCKGPIEFGRNHHIHWTCNTAEGEHLSAYSPEEVIPDGAKCITNHKCFDWEQAVDESALDHKLRVKCDDGMWKADEKTGGTPEQYKPVLNNADDPAETAEPIQEPTCTGGGAILKIPKANIQGDDGLLEGVELICETPVGPVDEFYTIKAPNSCLLLCNYQLGWTIDSHLTDEGVEVFTDDRDIAFEYEGDESNHVQTGAIIKCW